ncbi:MAG: hypothetical protein AABZ39_12855 [Spirochaetota bacterium]
MLAAIIVLALIEIAGFAFFYLYIVGPVRRKVERDIIESMEKDLNALVTEFNRSALQNVELIEERINRLKEAVAASKDAELSLLKASDKVQAKRAPVKKTTVHEDAAASDTSYGVAAYRSSTTREEKDITLTVGTDGVREEAVDIQSRIVSLYGSGVTVSQIAERVQMTRGEIEVILGMHGKL